MLYISCDEEDLFCFLHSYWRRKPKFVKDKIGTWISLGDKTISFCLISWLVATLQFLKLLNLTRKKYLIFKENHLFKKFIVSCEFDLLKTLWMGLFFCYWCQNNYYLFHSCALKKKIFCKRLFFIKNIVWLMAIFTFTSSQ